jgi:hypothetical protein
MVRVRRPGHVVPGLSNRGAEKEIDPAFVRVGPPEARPSHRHLRRHRRNVTDRDAVRRAIRPRQDRMLGLAAESRDLLPDHRQACLIVEPRAEVRRREAVGAAGSAPGRRLRRRCLLALQIGQVIVA